jgi:ubiquinone/menaquinone biosynthesis C-methylase UbiE
MPVAGVDGMVVLDYGCGPGHDLVGFGHYSRPARLIGMDVSPTSLSEARARLGLHGVEAELIQIDDSTLRLPLADDSVDYIHSSGVLHHLADPAHVLRELRRVLRPGGAGRVMVYNWDSLFLHLYVPYVLQIEQGLYSGWDVRAAFQRATDGARVPISRVYKPEEFVQLVESAGLECEFLGAAVSMLEMSILSRRFDAIGDRRLAREHRDFLHALRFDDGGWAITPTGYLAGVDGCFAIRRPSG